MIHIGLIESLFLFEKKSCDAIEHDMIKHDTIDTTSLIRVVPSLYHFLTQRVVT
jgi:hypothetical protein